MPGEPGSSEASWKARRLFAEWSGCLSRAPARPRAPPEAGLESQWVWAGDGRSFASPESDAFSTLLRVRIDTIIKMAMKIC